MLKPVQLGKSGLQVSQLCLGTLNFGVPGQGNQGDWTLPADEAREILRAAVDHGLFYFDCANAYGTGACEEVVGQLLREMLPRDEYVLTTKIAAPMGGHPNMGGLSRKHIIEGMDHALPWSVAAPIEETMEALNDLVRAGKVMYLGASSMFAWQFAELQMTAEHHGWARFISMQNHYNLIYREEEREMIPYCDLTGVGLTPWSPLARGILAGAYQGSFDAGSTSRSTGSDRQRTEGLYRGENDFLIADRLVKIAAKYGKTPAQMAIAWLLSKPAVSAPVVGVSKIPQLLDLIAATDITLESDDIAYLEELYRPLENLLSLGIS